MLSTQYRLRLDKVCKLIAEGKRNLTEMIWAQKLAKLKYCCHMVASDDSEQQIPT